MIVTKTSLTPKGDNEWCILFTHFASGKLQYCIARFCPFPLLCSLNSWLQRQLNRRQTVRVKPHLAISPLVQPSKWCSVLFSDIQGLAKLIPWCCFCMFTLLIVEGSIEFWFFHFVCVCVFACLIFIVFMPPWSDLFYLYKKFFIRLSPCSTSFLVIFKRAYKSIVNFMCLYLRVVQIN